VAAVLILDVPPALDVGSVRTVPETFRALDWLARRHAGESAALIAQRAGVPIAAVHRATDAYGPFPRPTQQLGRTIVDEAVLSERAGRWVGARRRGQTSTAIARAEGVSYQLVSRATAGHGPYPTPEVVERWVAARRAGRTLEAIAQGDAVRVAVVRRGTKPHGPFRMPGGRLPEGVVGVNGVARMAGVSVPAVVRWRKSGRLPEPDFTTASGRALWLPGTVREWLDSADYFSTCQVYGARCISIGHHISAVHAG
jgi:hypothetical protein